jgi:predicted dehydrogenase
MQMEGSASHSIVRTAVVGAGWVATHRHLPALRANDRFEVLGVIDRHPKRAATAALQFRIPHSAEAASLEDVGWLRDIDAITIATAPDSHARLIAEARNLGLHVLTEKPFTLDLGDAEVAARPGDKVIAVMHNFQFARSAERLWADLAAEALGTVRAVQAVQLSNERRRLPDWYETLPFGLFFDESPHLLYLLRRVIPDLRLESVDVSRRNEGQNTPSVVWARWSSEGARGIPITLSMNFAASVSEWYLAVHGSRAVGIVDLFRDIYLRVPQDGTHSTGSVFRSSSAATIGHWFGYLSSGFLHMTNHLRYGVDEVIRLFGDAIELGMDPEFCGRADALAVRRMQEEILTYPKSGGSG